LLGKLNLQDALVEKHLPKVKDKVQILLRSPDFDWRRKTAVEFLENMLEDLAAGREPLLRYAGKGFGYPYWSNTLRRIEATWVHVPPTYDPGKSYQLFIYYKCGGGIHFKDGKVTGGYRPDAQAANQTDTFHAWSSLDIQVKGRYGAAIEAEEFPAALSRDFSVDPDRIFFSGWSDGGFTVLMLAAHYPHLAAGIAPNCGNWQYANVENVALMRGSDLAGRRGGAAATSLRGDIDLDKTCRVAFAFNGVPSYGAEPDKLPKLFKWTTPEEFLAGPGTRIPVRNLVQTPLQMTEAVAQYVRKHKKIAPRPVTDSLTEYIANPRDNEFGGSDWLHLGVDRPKPGARAGDDRYTLALGIRAASEPEVAPPRNNTKQFLELALQGLPLSFDFASLERKLPVTAASVVTRYAVRLDKEGKTYALVAPEAGGAVSQAVLIDIQLANRGSRDLAITALLSDTVMRSIYGQVWPEEAKGKTWYAGYHRATGPAKQPPRREEAALLLGEGKSRMLMAPNAGYNFGLVGMARDLTLKAGQSLALPLLLISIDRPNAGPDINLAAALDALKPQLLKAATKTP
jgi:hypothetical protein